MSPAIPWLPGGQAELPAERFILFADGANDVQRIDETVTDKDGTAFTGEWQSATLNQANEGFEMSLGSLELYYAALGDTTIAVAGSGDGGETWTVDQVLPLLTTAGQIRRTRVDFTDTFSVTGFDIRFRLRLDQETLVSVYGFRPHLIDRGDLIL